MVLVYNNNSHSICFVIISLKNIDGHCVTVIVVENGHGDPSSNPGCVCFVFCIALILLVKVLHPTIPLPPMGK